MPGPDIRFWEMPELTSIGRLPMASPVRLAGSDSLDGRWRFTLVDAPDAAPEGWTDPAFDDTGWPGVDVPGCWTMQGFDIPIYTNVVVPTGAVPPLTPSVNPTGLYRTVFNVPDEWGGQRIVLHVGAAETVLAVHVNGAFVGLSKDSRLHAEFDVTAHAKEGTNTLACMVIRWSDASYVEAQDHWWHAGIERSVFLYTTPATHLADVKVTAGVDDGLEAGVVDVRAEVAMAEAEPGWRVSIELDGSEHIGDVPVGGFTGPVVRWRHRIHGVRRWSHEDPFLYPLKVSLIDPSGATVDTLTERIGFRRVEIAGRQLLINGQPVLIRGVNRHDFHPKTGRVVSVDDMRADVMLMKEFGFNAVRTSHYPNDPRFLDLCDELGLYVIDEANIESHAHMFTLCHDPRYAAAFLDRGARMVRRDKNHPCVIMWSLGNESGHGPHHDALAGWIRRYDPSRPVHYEGGIFRGWEGGQSVTDVVNPMYPPIARIVEWAERSDDPRPLIMCEYSHAMGNSNGCLAEYWDAIESHHGLQGGFIWEWWDHGLEQQLPDGRTRFAYGGDFGDRPNDGNFCLDGVVWPDRRPKPALWEHKHLASPVRARAKDLRHGLVEIENRQWFTALAGATVSFEVTVDGTVVQEGSLALPDIDPQQSAVVMLPIERPTLRGGQEPWLTIRVGDSWSQFPLPWQGRARRAIVRRAPVIEAPRLCLFRGPIDNDRIRAGQPREMTPGWKWEQWDLAARADDLVDHRSRRVDDRFEHEVDVPATLDDLPRVGVVLTLPPGFEHVEWLGLGPHETYPDRKRGGRFGRWQSTVSEQYVPYIRPQEHGGHADTRWLAVRRDDGTGLLFVCDEPRQCAVTHFTPSDLATTTHDVDLVPRAETFIHIDAKHRGLGTASCGPDTLPEYLVGPGSYRWTYRVVGLTPDDDAGLVARGLA